MVLDGLRLSFGYMLFVCGGVALLYCGHYFLGVAAVRGLFCMIVLFLLVMGALIGRGNALSCLVCWEYLGLVSVFLILYYSKGARLRASIITLVTSRAGDVGLFVFFCLGECYMVSGRGLVLFLVGLIIATKSACYPLVS